MAAIIALLLLAAAAFPALAQDVQLIGVIGDKAAIVAVDGGEPKTIRVGQSWKGIGVVSVEKDRATFDIDGKRRVIMRGQHNRSAAGAAATPGGRQQAILSADPRGHFIAEGSINGGHMRFLVDTGATAVAIPAADAQRLGLNYRAGQRVSMSTANGVSVAYAVMLERVKVGGIDLYNVEGLVVERGLPIPLLGMTFLNRVEMKREGQTMTLTRLF